MKWVGLARAGKSLAVLAVAVALIRSIAAVWFSSEIVATPRTEEIASPAVTGRVVVIVIDGLRYDTALESDLMPRLKALGRAGSAGMSLASKVTMTGLGVRTLGTGTSPALADILLEVRLPLVTFDNVFASIRRRGGHVAWLGNTAWKELFGDSIDIDSKIDRELAVMARADNVWAPDRVIVRRAVRMLARDDWQLCIVHLGGLDNASHRFTPFGDQFRAKARAVDDDIAQLVTKAGDHTTVIITSDHGTSDRGHHGSGEPVTRRTPLVFTGASVAHGHRLEAEQTDLAPTIAALLGLPIPAPSEGQIQLEALDLPASTANALRAANVRQLQRYASAYAADRGIAPPTIAPTPAGMRRLGAWIEEVRTDSVLVPALWAFSFGLIALSLFGAPAPTDGLVAAIATWSVLTGGRGELAAMLALLATVASAVIALRRHARRWVLTGLGVAGLAALEITLALWKLNHRYIEMDLNDLHRFIGVSDQLFSLVLTGLAVIAGALLLRRWWPASPWAIIGVIFGASALADSVAIQAAIACAGAAGLATVGRRELAPLAVAIGSGIVTIGIANGFALDHVTALDLLAPLALAALGCFLGPATRASRIALAIMGLAAMIVRLLDNPQLAYRLALLAIMVLGVVLTRKNRDSQSVALLGWTGAIALSMLSRSTQLPGLVAWTAFAALIGRARQVEDTSERGVLVATLAAIGFRFACFALFEGAFEFSHLEVWLAYQGNSGTAVAFGAAIIAVKLALPLGIGLALTTAGMTAGSRRTTVMWTTSFLCLRIAHIAIGMTIARGTFYSPYLDSGQLAFTYLMLASVPFVIAWFAAGAAWRERAHP